MRATSDQNIDRDFRIADWRALEETITGCRRCPRLVTWREAIAETRRRAYRDEVYWGKPVPGFGDYRANVLVVGLAPGAHGSNRTGRMFTGDSSGQFLYSALYRAGFSNQPSSLHQEDGLSLKNMFISAICRCAPPGNQPTRQEIANCLTYLVEEIDLLDPVRVIVALGQVAFIHTLQLYRKKEFDIPKFQFGHGAVYPLGEGLPWLVSSYHPSRQNTQTGRLTEVMFDKIWKFVFNLSNGSGSCVQ